MSVLRRKAQAGKQEHQARSMTVSKSLRIGLAKSADDVLDMALVVIGATQEKCECTSLTAELDKNDLLVLVDGPFGAVGGVVMGAGLVAALVQQQTTGKVTPPSENARRLTATDASLCAPLMDMLFQKANGLLETDRDRADLGLYRFGARAENKRLFELALEEPEYHVLRLTIDVAGGVLQSALTLILPMRNVVDPELLGCSENEDAQVAPAITLEPTVLGLQAELSVMLCDISVPLDRVSALQTGDILKVPPEAFEGARLLCRGNKYIASGAVGQMDGQRAFMITDPLARQAGAENPAINASDVAPNVKETDVPRELLKAGPADVSVPEPLFTEGEEALPELPDLADIPDLPEIDGLVDDKAGTGLPELPDLPDFIDDLSDLDDLPKSKIA